MSGTPKSPAPKPGVLDIAPYVGGRAHAPGATGPVYKLSSNESALPPSPDAIAAFKSAQTSLEIYPDGGAEILREAIGAVHGLNPDRIVCGNGSGEILTLLAEAHARTGDISGARTALAEATALQDQLGLPAAHPARVRASTLGATLAATGEAGPGDPGDGHHDG